MSAPCGTYASYQRHRRVGEPPCEACKAAWAAYTRDLRHRRPDIAETHRRHNRARKRALERLAALQPDVFAVLLAEERARVDTEARQ